MAFRLQSFAAGFAKEATKNIRALDEEYRESLKNTAADLAKEAKEVRKTRMSAVIDYSSKGKKLKRDYKLTDAQIQTLLSSGTDSYESFVNSVRAGNQAAKLANPNAEFDAAGFAQSLFEGEVTGDGILSLDQQAQAYAASRTPSTIDLQTAASGISAGTQTMLTGIGTEEVEARLRGSVGDLGDYSGPVMTDTGLSVRGQAALTPAELIALQGAAAKVEQTKVSTAAQREQTNLTKEQVQAAKIANKYLDEEKQASIEQTMANIGLTEQRISESVANVDTAILNQEKLQNEINSWEKWNDVEKGAALDLVEAKVISAKRFTDLEQMQVTYAAKANELRDMANQEEDSIARNNLLSQAAFWEDRIAGTANKINATDPSSSLFAKANPPALFNNMLKTQTQLFDITGKFNPISKAYEYEIGDKMPQYISAFASAVDEFGQQYARTGLRYAEGRTIHETKERQLEKSILRYANSEMGKAKNIGSKTADFLNDPQQWKNDPKIVIGALAIDPDGDIVFFNGTNWIAAQQEQ
jgi:hypothetical protein